ncbi:MAG TPA: nucleotidyltransferase domain-containing protein [Kofleriaceae bacterium]|nr:nucleotidyltransferase domain-containing protein [Kofleriaceae bacterium]
MERPKTPRIPIPRERLAEVCRRHHILRLSLFGSVLREDFGPTSDVDLLVEFDPAYPVGLKIFDVEADLSRLFDGRRVDIVDPKYLNRHLKDRILHDAVLQYAA